MLSTFPWKIASCSPSFPSPEGMADPQKGLGTKLTITIQMFYIHCSNSAASNVDLEHWETETKKEEQDQMLFYRVSLADLLSRRQKEMISKGTGCDYQTRSIRCPERDFYRTITGECNNR